MQNKNPLELYGEYSILYEICMQRIHSMLNKEIEEEMERWPEADYSFKREIENIWIEDLLNNPVYRENYLKKREGTSYNYMTADQALFKMLRNDSKPLISEEKIIMYYSDYSDFYVNKEEDVIDEFIDAINNHPKIVNHNQTMEGMGMEDLKVVASRIIES